MRARLGHEALERESEDNKRPGTRQRWEDAHADGGNGLGDGDAKVGDSSGAQKETVLGCG